MNFSQTVTDGENIGIDNKYKVAYGLSIGIFIFILGPFQRSRSCTIPLSISRKRWRIWQTLLLSTNRKSHMVFRLLDLNLILAYSKGDRFVAKHFGLLVYIMFGCSSVHPSVCPVTNVRLCTVNKRRDLEEPIFAHICMLTRHLRLPIVIKICSYGVRLCYVRKRCVRKYFMKCHQERTAEPRSISFSVRINVGKVNLYINFHPNCQRSWPHCQGQRFDYSYVNILQTMTHWEKIIIANRKLHMAFRLAYLHLILIHSKAQCDRHFYCEYLANGYINQTLPLPSNMKLHISMLRFYLGLILKVKLSVGTVRRQFVDLVYIM